MNAIELFHKDGVATGIFYCRDCRTVHRSKELANACCVPTKCKHCGKQSDRKHWLICTPCEAIEREAKEVERFTNASKVTEWGGWVFSEGIGHQDGYFADVDMLIDYCVGEGIEVPKYAWTCVANHFVNASVEDITSRMDDAYEDFDPESLKGLPELEAALDRFNEMNHDAVSYTPDYNVALLLPEQAL